MTGGCRRGDRQRSAAAGGPAPRTGDQPDRPAVPAAAQPGGQPADDGDGEHRVDRRAAARSAGPTSRPAPSAASAGVVAPRSGSVNVTTARRTRRAPRPRRAPAAATGRARAVVVSWMRWWSWSVSSSSGATVAPAAVHAGPAARPVASARGRPGGRCGSRRDQPSGRRGGHPCGRPHAAVAPSYAPRHVRDPDEVAGAVAVGARRPAGARAHRRRPGRARAARRRGRRARCRCSTLAFARHDRQPGAPPDPAARRRGRRGGGHGVPDAARGRAGGGRASSRC